MKKPIILIGALVLGVLAYNHLYGNTTSTTTTTTTDDVFKKYDNQIIEDADGYWMLVKDGKLFTPTSITTVQAWQNANPTKPGVVKVNTKVWDTYGQAYFDGKYYGGQF